MSPGAPGVADDVAGQRAIRIKALVDRLQDEVRRLARA